MLGCSVQSVNWLQQSSLRRIVRSLGRIKISSLHSNRFVSLRPCHNGEPQTLRKVSPPHAPNLFNAKRHLYRTSARRFVYITLYVVTKTRSNSQFKPLSCDCFRLSLLPLCGLKEFVPSAATLEEFCDETSCKYRPMFAAIATTSFASVRSRLKTWSC